MGRTITRLYLALVCAVAPGLAHALDVFVCEPEWGALVTELAGHHASVTVAATALQDPHYLQARPSFIAKARNADLLVCTGAELEVGWLPLLLRRSANPDIQPGTSGHLLAADYVRKLEVSMRLDRAEGDVHPQGNPHVHLNPHNITRVARQVTQRLVELDGTNASWYLVRADDFADRWATAIEAWELEGASLAGLRLVAHHRSFSYLANWLDLDIVANLESKPGIPPSAAHLARLLEQFSGAAPAAIIRTPYENEKPSRWLSTRTGATAVVLPYTVGGADAAVDLFTLFDVTLTALLMRVPEARAP